jgi:hypothetical protein
MMISWIDVVYPRELGWPLVFCSAVAATPRLSWNLRVTPDDQALIDRTICPHPHPPPASLGEGMYHTFPRGSGGRAGWEYQPGLAAGP